jgi:hypothetical protein
MPVVILRKAWGIAGDVPLGKLMNINRKTDYLFD